MGLRTEFLDIDESGQASTGIAYPNTASLRLMLRAQPRSTGTVNLGEVDLTDVRDGQVIQLDIDPEKLAAALEKIGK